MYELNKFISHGVYERINEDKVKEDFENISYTMTYDILVSDQFGVAQKRPRLFCIGSREDINQMM